MAIGPAVLKKPLDEPSDSTSPPVSGAASAERVITGRALIFWDPSLATTRYRRKRDAIDTDQYQSLAAGG